MLIDVARMHPVYLEVYRNPGTSVEEIRAISMVFFFGGGVQGILPGLASLCLKYSYYSEVFAFEQIDINASRISLRVHHQRPELLPTALPNPKLTVEVP